MCEFPSWIELEDNEVYFLTDKDLENPIFKDNIEHDLVGHSAIEQMYPKIKGKHKEGFPVHPEVLKAINSGKMNKMMKIGGYKEFHLNKNGELHREDGPAVVYENGTKHWYKNGNLHREDGPAIEYFNGSKHWYLNGKYHREDGPACEYSDGSKYWYLNGKYHREDGPACEYSNGDKYWYLNGKQLTEKEFNKLKK